MSRAQPEADLSAALAEWLAYQHPHDNPKSLFCFMVPNERGSGTTRQREIAAGQLRRMGLRPGVADWVFVWRPPSPSWQPHLGTRGAPEVGFIELKAPADKPTKRRAGRQTPNQRTFQQQAEAFGLRYAVCRSLEECIETLKGWGAA